ncbi:hypothetical protein V1264_001456 [Littorina saxatilis]|uniref:Uncharacterized protein n=1 Tax=Littorina saxatilis TaxID=31220 RepID=A0AAN9C215_9CAEN
MPWQATTLNRPEVYTAHVLRELTRLSRKTTSIPASSALPSKLHFSSADRSVELESYTFYFGSQDLLYGGRGVGPTQTSERGGPNLSDLYPSTCPAWVTLPGAEAPAGIALRVTEARKPSHHDKEWTM